MLPADLHSSVQVVYIERAIYSLKRKGLPLNEQLIAHLSPLEWEHINLSGDDGDDAINTYQAIWHVDPAGMEFTHYFAPEFFGSKVSEQPLKPLTIRMLVESAKAGRWLY